MLRPHAFVVIFGMLALSLISCSKKQEQQHQAGATGQLPAGEVTYTVPEEWEVRHPSSQMRKAEFVLPGVEGKEAAELAVFFFPGTGGSVQANLDRWYGQFKQPDGSATRDRARIEQVQANGLNVTVTQVTGIYLKPQAPMMMGGPVNEMPDYGMMAAIVETADGPWFFKAVGPEVTLVHWRDSFHQFVRSFRVQ